MRPYKGFKAEKATYSSSVPAGGYVGKIMTAKEVNYTWGDRLEIAFDITEGEFTRFFKKQFDSSNAENKKWKGVCRINIPKDDDKEWKKTAFNNLIYSVEESNPGYHWDWNEAGLKGKLCGFIFNNFQWQMDDGRSGWSTECKTAASVDDIHEGTYKIPKDRPLKNQPASTANSFTEASLSDDEIPF